MNTFIICLLIFLAFVAVIFMILLLLPLKEKGGNRTAENALSIQDGGSIVTVHKIGPVTSVTIRQTVNDHWEGKDGVALPMLAPEVTRHYEPDLWNEYMDPKTSAIRKYELIDEAYSMGFTLPLIKGLDEQYKKEIKKALSSSDPDARTIHERTPVDLSREHRGGPDSEREEKKVQINDELRHAPLPDMEEPKPEAKDNQQE